MKIIYLHRITDNAYFIYKLSNYGSDKIKLIHVGMAYDNHGNYTKKFKSLFVKYNLKDHQNNIHTTSDSYLDFCKRLYLDSQQMSILVDSIPIPTHAFKMLERIYYMIDSDKEKTVQYELEMMCIRYPDKVLETIMKSNLFEMFK